MFVGFIHKIQAYIDSRYIYNKVNFEVLENCTSGQTGVET